MVVSDFMKQYTKPCRSKFHKDGFLWRNFFYKWSEAIMAWTKIWLGVLLLFSRISLIQEYIGWIKRII
jgi:hypothetical protein